jgi:asparagine synthase (glutamine-hydrolysing)
VTAIAKSYNSTLKTFTVSFEGEYDEAPLAKLVADRYNTVHHEIRISFDHLKNDVEQILANYGEPFMDSSAIPSYYVAGKQKNTLQSFLTGMEEMKYLVVTGAIYLLRNTISLNPVSW